MPSVDRCRRGRCGPDARPSSARVLRPKSQDRRFCCCRRPAPRTTQVITFRSSTAAPPARADGWHAARPHRSGLRTTRRPHWRESARPARHPPISMDARVYVGRMWSPRRNDGIGVRDECGLHLDSIGGIRPLNCLKKKDNRGSDANLDTVEVWRSSRHGPTIEALPSDGLLNHTSQLKNAGMPSPG